MNKTYSDHQECSNLLCTHTVRNVIPKSLSNAKMAVEKSTSVYQYLIYSHKHGTIVLIKPGAIILAYSQIVSMISVRYTLFVHVIYSCTAGSVEHVKNKLLKQTNSVGNGSSKVRICSYDGTWCTEYNGTTFETVHQILMTWGRFFICYDNIWHTTNPHSGFFSVHTHSANSIPKSLSNVIIAVKNRPHFINIWDTVTNIVPLCSVNHVSSYEHILELLAWFLWYLAYLCMLFILALQTVQSTSRINNILK